MIQYRESRIQVTIAQAKKWDMVKAKPGGSLHARGPCPACGASLDLPVTLNIVTTATAQPPTTRLTRTFHCNCTEQHPQRLATTPEGCGRSWSLTIVRDGDAFTFEPGDPALASASRELERVAASQVESLRAAGDKWTGGVAAILGLLTVAGIAVGKDAVSDLATLPKVLAGIAVGVALGAAVAAIYFGYQAAYGWPTDVDVSDDDKLAAWFAKWTSRAGQAADKIRRSVASAVAAIVLLAIAVAFIWFGDEAQPAAPRLTVSYNQNADATQPGSACGELVESRTAELHMTVSNGGSSDTKVIPVEWITKVAPSATC